jgi:hypothetical protein
LLQVLEFRRFLDDPVKIWCFQKNNDGLDAPSPEAAYAAAD